MSLHMPPSDAIDRLRVNVSAPLNRGLLGWWRAGGGLNGRAPQFYDMCGRTNIPFVNSPTWSGDRHPNSRRSLRCAASEAGVRITCPTYLRIARPIHICGWVRSLGSPSAYADMFGVSYTDSDTSPYEAYSLGVSDTGYIRGYANNGSTLAFLNAPSYSLSSYTNWTHLAFEVIGTSGYIYLNGALIASGTSLNPFGDPIYGTAKLTIGASTTGTSRNINCLIDDVRIANRGYGEEGIRKLYQAALLGWPTEFAKPRRYWFPAVVESPPSTGTDLHLLQNKSSTFIPSWHAQRLC